MRSNNRNLLFFFLILMVFPFSGCAGLSPYGKLYLTADGKDRVTIEQLVERWQDYDVYWAGVSTHRPSAVLFDPKADDRVLQVHHWWVKLDRKETLLDLVKWLQFDMDYDPEVRMVLSPDDRLFGYMYTAWHYARILVKDEKTLWVDDLSMPPELRFIGSAEQRDGW
ncbi:MAG: hypothetical protein AB1512_16605 [Thermodesulfobacteriota bacterium]